MKNRTILIIILISIAVAVLAGFFASSRPDGLEKVAGNLKFEGKAVSTPGLFVDYTISIIRNPSFSRALAGIIGIVFIIFIFRSIARVKHLGEILKKLLNLR